MIQSEKGGGKVSEKPEIVLSTATAIYKILNNRWILMFMVNIYISKDEYSFMLNFDPPIMLFSRDNGYLLGDPPPPCYLKLSFGRPPLPQSG